MVRLWMFEASSTILLFAQRHLMDRSISCDGYSITAQMQMLGALPTSHRCISRQWKCILRLSRSYSNTTQTSTHSITWAGLRCVGSCQVAAPRESSWTWCGNYWSMGQTQISVTTTTQLRYIKPHPESYSRPLDC